MSYNSYKDDEREKFRKALDDLGHPEATVFSHWALEAYDKVHCPELRNEQMKRKPIDWDKPLQITTNHGTFKVRNLGLGWKDKRLVQIEECSARFPSHDGTLPNVYVPNDDGYVVQFDRWIENVPNIQGKINDAVWKYLWDKSRPETEISPNDIVIALEKGGLKIVEIDSNA